MMQSKEEILTSALPYIQRYEGTTFVIKYGGAAMTDASLRESFAKDVTLLSKIGIHVVIVHGGGNAITSLSAQLGLASQFIAGQRYTDASMRDVVVMTLAGTVNKEVVGLVNRAGGSAVGLSGVDNGLLTAKRYAPRGVDLGLVGEIDGVNVGFLQTLIGQGMIPVIAPIAVGEDGEVYNVNADLAASAIASRLEAEKLFFLSDTAGVVVDGELVPTLTNGRAQQLIRSGAISGGMIPKVNSAFDALSQGVHKVHVIDGSKRHSLLLEIFTHEGVGTQIIREERVFGNRHFTSDVRAKQDLLDLSCFSKQDLEDLLRLTDILRTTPERPLEGKHVTLLFQKPSLRTRVSFEVGVAQLGGTSLYLSNEGVGLGKRESVQDVARVLASYSDCIVARLFDHRLIEGLSKHAAVPVVNALTDLSHPCQILADLYTIHRHGALRPGVKVAFIGDGNNVANSWLELAAVYPMHFVLATPAGYDPDPNILKRAVDAGISTIEVTADPIAAARDADVLYTDVWTSMGQEAESAKRLAAFDGFQINGELLAVASPDVLIMHCLPAHRGEEITDEVMESEHSVIFEQAENRLHVQKAMLVTLLSDPLHFLNPSTSDVAIEEPTTIHD